MIDEFGLRPENDGIDHINVYSKGKTELGRWLSNFSHSPFNHPYHGHFESVEGYWYWLSTGMKHDSLRRLHGFDAKRQGRKYKTVPVENYETHIEVALYCKVVQNPLWIPLIRESHLPFIHYYVYGGKPTHLDDSVWVMDILDDIRQQLQNN